MGAMTQALAQRRREAWRKGGRKKQDLGAAASGDAAYQGPVRANLAGRAKAGADLVAGGTAEDRRFARQRGLEARQPGAKAAPVAAALLRQEKHGQSLEDYARLGGAANTRRAAGLDVVGGGSKEENARIELAMKFARKVAKALQKKGAA